MKENSKESAFFDNLVSCEFDGVENAMIIFYDS